MVMQKTKLTLLDSLTSGFWIRHRNQDSRCGVETAAQSPGEEENSQIHGTHVVGVCGAEGWDLPFLLVPLLWGSAVLPQGHLTSLLPPGSGVWELSRACAGLYGGWLPWLPWLLVALASCRSAPALCSGICSRAVGCPTSTSCPLLSNSTAKISWIRSS